MLLCAVGDGADANGAPANSAEAAAAPEKSMDLRSKRRRLELLLESSADGVEGEMQPGEKQATVSAT